MNKPSFIVFETSTVRAVREYTYQKAAVNYLARMGAGYSVTDKATFLSLPVPMIKVKSLMTGAEVEIPADTPWSCRPDSESYWSA